MSRTTDESRGGRDHGGSVGDISRQSVDPSSENTGGADPVIDADEVEEVTDGVALTRDEDAEPTDEDIDAEADETQGQPS